MFIARTNQVGGIKKGEILSSASSSTSSSITYLTTYAVFSIDSSNFIENKLLIILPNKQIT